MLWLSSIYKSHSVRWTNRTLTTNKQNQLDIQQCEQIGNCDSQPSKSVIESQINLSWCAFDSELKSKF